MSNIYIQEPPTNGKVLLSTSFGDIDVELWSKEAPKACRNFVQLCMEGYYNETIFHRVIKGFIAQGGDPTGTGTGGESIYGKPFKDEFHQRLKFNRRGLVAMANAGPHDNGSQFFFTLDRADELNSKHTIFGKVTGNTLYNMIRFNDVDVDKDDRPYSPPKIFKSQVLSCPFDDIEPRRTKKNEKNKAKEKVKSKSKATKNYKLLSFGEEAEEDEEGADEAAKELQIKSSHDVLADPKLSSQPAIDIHQEKTEEVKPHKSVSKEKAEEKDTDSESEEDRKEKRKKKRKKKELEESTEKKKKKEPQNGDTKMEAKDVNDMKIRLIEERHKFREKQRTSEFLKKGESREKKTLLLLKEFESNLCSIVKRPGEESEDEREDINSEALKTGSWMKHSLKFPEGFEDAKDANTKTDDWYDIYDPRNPIVKRRREASSKKEESK